MQILKHITRETQIRRGSPKDGLRPQKNCKSFYINILSNKMKGYNLQQARYNSSSLSHSLSHIHKDHFYSAIIQSTTVLQCLPFIKGIPWKNTMTTENHGPVNHTLLTKS